ncbi:MAG: hypothetical protein RLZZ299_1393 [Pseudomonadota bacterium]|jgi:hypothetical protein
MRPVVHALALGLALVLPGIPSAFAAPDAAALERMLKVIDDRQQNNGDYASTVFIEQKEKGKSDLVYQANIYRRDVSDKLVILFAKPQSEAGKGYLRVDSNLFFYDPGVGKWERRTERERIGGTNSQRADFDQSRLAEEYTPAWVAEEKLGAFTTDRLKLSAKAGQDVAYPVVELWIDRASGNTLKRQDFALSGRLMRTTYYPEWLKKFSPSKKAEVYVPRQIRIFDEVEKGKSTTVVLQDWKLDSLDDSMFTKAWLESKSR